MVGLGTALGLLALWFAWVWWRRRDRLADMRWFLRAAVAAPVAAYIALEPGWIVTEVGRQPWVVYGILRTEDAVTTRGGGDLDLAVAVHRALCGPGRGRGARDPGDDAPLARGRPRRLGDPLRPARAGPRPAEPAREGCRGPRPAPPSSGSGRWYTPCSPGPTSGPGCGTSPRGAPSGRPAGLIDHAIGPVWEANHVWLIYILVILWTAFPRPTLDITTLIVPFALAALGSVLRGAGFAFRKVSTRMGEGRASGAVFAAGR